MNKTEMNTRATAWEQIKKIAVDKHATFYKNGREIPYIKKEETTEFGQIQTLITQYVVLRLTKPIIEKKEFAFIDDDALLIKEVSERMRERIWEFKIHKQYVIRYSDIAKFKQKLSDKDEDFSFYNNIHANPAFIYNAVRLVCNTKKAEQDTIIGRICTSGNRNRPIQITGNYGLALIATIAQ